MPLPAATAAKAAFLLAAGVAVALVLMPATRAAVTVPVPCEAPGVAYPAVGEAPDIRVHYYDELGPRWAPAACAGWKPANVAFLVVTAGKFHHSGGVEEIAVRLGKISDYNEIRYWSHTRQAWRPLMPEAFALSGPDPAERRADFTAAEMLKGDPHYFWQSAAGKFAYRVQVREGDARRLVIEMENITGFQALFLPVFKPGDARILYFIEQEAGDVWRYYALIAVSGPFAGILRSGHESFINRAGAIYRYFSGIPMTQDPPPIKGG
jgi:hypothetical protein